MSRILEENLEYRSNQIQTAQTYLERTRDLFEQFGSPELKRSHAKFDELNNALNAKEVRLVVIGEFSRGKSSLVNALLGINLLRSAQEATTAINTFVKSLPAGRTDKFIKIHFQDGRTPKEVAWTDEHVLERWSTELDESNQDARREVDFIEIFMPHPLLDKGLVLIDTPGLQSVVAHHEDITRKAIAEAHIALWVQSTEQLGGNATEWNFLSETIRKNFRKFITAVNKWDAVLQPTDPQEKAKPESLRVQQKLDRIRKNFQQNLSDLPAHELNQMTDDHHLMGVSAWWALDKEDPEKQRRSGVDVLSTRIAALFTSGEAMEQVFLKPLQQLSGIQHALLEGIEDTLKQLDSDDSLEKRQSELELFEQEIKGIEQESQIVKQESQVEHQRAAKSFVDQVKKELVSPLKMLKSEIESRITENWVRQQVQKKVRELALPEDLDTEFHATSQRVGEAWKTQKEALNQTLEGLRGNYLSQMQKHTRQLQGSLKQMDIELPSLDIRFQLDFSNIESYHQQSMELKNSIHSHDQELNRLDSEIDQNAADRAAMEIAQQRVRRAEGRIQSMGAQPSPSIKTGREQVSSGGVYSDAEYRNYTYEDDSNVKEWRSKLEEREEALSKEEAYLEQVMQEEQRRTGIRMSLEKAKAKYEKEMDKLRREQQRLEEEAKKAQQDMAMEAAKTLVQRTAGQLEQRISYLEEQATEAIEKLFFDQLELLQQCVEEQFLEPLKAKRQRREEVQSLLQQGKEEIERRKTALAQGLTEVQGLLSMTEQQLGA